MPSVSGNANLPVTQTVVRLTDAQIKKLPSIAPVILPAPGVDKVYILLGVVVFHDAWTPYTGVAAASSFALYGNAAYSELFIGLGFLNNATALQMHSGMASALGSGDFNASILAPVPDAPNGALILSLDNGTATDLGGGDPANELVVTVVYAVADFS